ncbi:MAG: translation initiation factor IF-2 N-terminal domain-containing protein, partial [Candidatus Hydrothermae bacterium]|nr:translation initiation factor IF-2 N-terminal domain-containing protein [Candidatus Hydrothermae bacterium]
MSKKTKGSGGEKIRKVSDLAREVKLSPRAVIDMLKGMGYSVRSAQSTVTEEMVKEVKEKLQTLKQEERKSLERRKQIWGGPEEPRKKEESRRQDTSRKPGRTERKPARARTKPRKKEPVVPTEQEKKLILPGPVT